MACDGLYVLRVVSTRCSRRTIEITMTQSVYIPQTVHKRSDYHVCIWVPRKIARPWIGRRLMVPLQSLAWRHMVSRLSQANSEPTSRSLYISIYPRRNGCTRLMGVNQHCGVQCKSDKATRFCCCTVFVGPGIDLLLMLYSVFGASAD